MIRKEDIEGLPLRDVLALYRADNIEAVERKTKLNHEKHEERARQALVTSLNMIVIDPTSIEIVETEVEESRECPYGSLEGRLRVDGFHFRSRMSVTSRGSGWDCISEVLVGQRDNEDVWVRFNGLHDLSAVMAAGVPPAPEPPKEPTPIPPTNGELAFKLLDIGRGEGNAIDLLAALVFAVMDLTDVVSHLER